MPAYKDLFNSNIRLSMKTAASALSAYPGYASVFARFLRAMKEAERRRENNAADGVEVPPMMIVSTTDECNLACKGCYASERESSKAGLSGDRAAEILAEASELGVGIVLLAGGEPLLSCGWLAAMANHPEMLGLVFTNGTLLDASFIDWFKRHKHIIPVLSIEGDERRTDNRRGEGVYVQVMTAMAGLHSAGVPFGLSVTVTGENIGEILTDDFASEYIGMGCRLFVFVEYVPVAAGTDSLMLTKVEKTVLTDFALNAERRHPAVFVAFPGDEAQFGGCLAAGRGFINISTSGDVEPCPFAPFSDVNLRKMPLKDALKSRLLRKVRENHNKLIEGEGGCALWHHRSWLETLAK